MCGRGSADSMYRKDKGRPNVPKLGRITHFITLYFTIPYALQDPPSCGHHDFQCTDVPYLREINSADILFTHARAAHDVKANAVA